MKTLKLLLTTTVLLSSFNASGESGGNSGGGGGFAVTDSTNIELADLYQARRGRGPFRKTGALQIISALNSETEEMIVSKVVAKAKHINPEYGRLLQQSIEHIKTSIELTDETIQIYDDTGIVSLPAGWVLTPLARYSDHENYLAINKKYYQRLGIVDRAALLVHEAIYFTKRRIPNETSSYNTQLEVGLLFSTDKNSLIDFSEVESPKQCTRILAPSDGRTRESIVIGIKDNKLLRWDFVSAYEDGLYGLNPFPITIELSGQDPDVPAIQYRRAVPEFREAVRLNTVSDFLVSSNSIYQSEGMSFHCVDVK